MVWSLLLLWKACCLFWIRSFKCFIIQGACVFMGTFLTGIRRSRPVYITCSKTQSNSLQVLKELSNRGQSNEHRYLPVSAFWLGCRLRLKFNLSGAVPTFLIWGQTDMVLWSDRAKGGKVGSLLLWLCKLVNTRSKIVSFRVGVFMISFDENAF